MWRESPGSNYVTMLGKEEVREEVDYKDYVSNKKNTFFVTTCLLQSVDNQHFAHFQRLSPVFFSLNRVCFSFGQFIFLSQFFKRNIWQESWRGCKKAELMNKSKIYSAGLKTDNLKKRKRQIERERDD